MSTFRYLLACADVDNNNKLMTLKDVADSVFMPRIDFPCQLKLYAVLGMNLERTAWNKTLDLLSWKVGQRDGKRAALVHVKTALELPQIEGFTSVSFPVFVPIDSPGVYGFDLLDRDGVFGVSEESIATFDYAVGYLD